jgi:basic membrane protein A and related proteins
MSLIGKILNGVVDSVDQALGEYISNKVEEHFINSSDRDVVLSENNDRATKTKIKVGIAYDIGGIGDKGINDLANAGLQNAKKNFGIDTTEVTIKISSECQNKLDQLVKNKCDLIIAVGNNYSSVLGAVAKNNPKVKFCIIADDNTIAMSNVFYVVFDVAQGSYLAGVAAALATKSNTIGFIGGVNTPIIQRYAACFVAGVNATNKKATVVVNYVTEFPDLGGFNNLSKAEGIATGQIANGCDVLYSVASVSDAGTFAAAAAAPKTVWTIGNDTDKYLTASASEKKIMLTSMVTHIDIAVYDIIYRQVTKKNFNDVLVSNAGAGIHGYSYDLNNNGVGLSYSGGYINQYKAQINKAISDIITKKITLPN